MFSQKKQPAKRPVVGILKYCAEYNYLNNENNENNEYLH